ncbi:hypothetical protein FA13DRAFT_1713194 [Coprinellus micaceus]|uniref:Uncharacterized protein n=1 Tax=Coprinellus micaceus TaxID=71717 RepID=A0A4Y7SXM6_COPMI|nr:hypothetical protein FA13DRAFT_1713194 [Coprinellus micaceus]
MKRSAVYTRRSSRPSSTLPVRGSLRVWAISTVELQGGHELHSSRNSGHFPTWSPKEGPQIGAHSQAIANLVARRRVRASPEGTPIQVTGGATLHIACRHCFLRSAFG